MPLSPLPAHVDLPALEHEVLERWQADKVFERSLEQSAGGPTWMFYEGPPTANGTPGTHHVEARVFKDVFPRYQTMKGYHVPRKAGWDCHGLPVEIAVEKELGFAGKPDIERVRDRRVQRPLPGVGAAARRRVHRDDRADGLLGRLSTTPTGRWTRPTSRASGGRSSRSSTRACWSRTTGSRRTARAAAPGCPTTRSPRATRPSSTRRCTCGSRSPPAELRRYGADLLVWTTTPWTLVSNTAVAVNPRRRVRGRAQPAGHVRGRRAAAGRGARRGPGRGAGPVPGHGAGALGLPRGRSTWSRSPARTTSSWPTT